MIINTNNNRNNNNNNDIQATFGSVNTNQQSSEATQSGSTMTMITVPPSGTPIVIPLGKALTDGRVLLDDGVETPGVMWESPFWRVTDEGVIFYKGNKTQVAKGVQYFGLVGEDNLFKLLPDDESSPISIEQVRALNSANITRSSRTSPPLLEVPGLPVLVKESDLRLLKSRLLSRAGRRLVMVVIPPAGPPVTLTLGWLLPGGVVSLDTGVEVEGIYWENLDRIIYTNGSIVYKGTGVEEVGAVVYGTVGDGGAITVLPEISDYPVDISLLRSINNNKPSQILDYRAKRSTQVKKRLYSPYFVNLVHSVLQYEISTKCSDRILCNILRHKLLDDEFIVTKEWDTTEEWDTIEEWDIIKAECDEIINEKDTCNLLITG